MKYQFRLNCRIIVSLGLVLIVLGGCSRAGKIALVDYFDSWLFEDRDYSSEISYPEKSGAACPKWFAGDTIQLDKSLTLPPGCYFEKVTVRITAPNVVYDCNGSVFNGLSIKERHGFGEPYDKMDEPKFDGIIISGSERNKKQRMENVTIKNCQLVNYVNAVSVTYNLTTHTKDLLRAGKFNEDNIRKFSPRNISLVDSKLLNSHKHAIFLHRYVTGFSLRNSEIKGSGNSAVYLEAGTKRSEFLGNVFEGNGFSSYSQKTRERSARRTALSRREAIAIDSSTHNVIKHNVFRENGDGGIYLYKNCWEHAKKPEQLPRTDGADYNRIESNNFVDETVGIWIGERADRDLSAFECGDPIFSRKGSKEFYRDYASHNIIQKNSFDKVGVGVNVQADNNTVSENIFENVAPDKSIISGSQIRLEEKQPITGNLIGGNIIK